MNELSLLLFLAILLTFRINGTAALTASCGNLTAETLDEISKGDCTELDTTNGYVLRPEDGNNLWDGIVQAIMSIRNVKIIMDGSTATKFDISKLRQISTDLIFIADNPELTSISLIQVSSGIAMSIKALIVTGNPKLHSVKLDAQFAAFVGNIRISDNQMLHTIELNLLQFLEKYPTMGQIQIANNSNLRIVDMKWADQITVTGDFSIEHNDQLHEINLPKLKAINLRGDFIIRENSKLMELRTASVLEMNINRYWIFSKNKLLERFELPLLAKLTVGKGIQISGNTMLSRISLGQTPVFRVAQLRIFQNRGLSSILTDVKYFNSMDLEIYGNPHLSRKFLKPIKTMKMIGNKRKIYLQTEGECSFEEEITDLGDLAACKYVRGDLILAKNAGGSAKDAHLNRVLGNVELANVGEAKLRFLSKAKVDGRVSSDLCHLSTLYGMHVRSCHEEEVCPSCRKCHLWVIIIGVVSVVLLLVIIAWFIYQECCKNSTRSLLKRMPQMDGSGTQGTTRTRTPINKENFDVDDYF